MFIGCDERAVPSIRGRLGGRGRAKVRDKRKRERRQGGRKGFIIWWDRLCLMSLTGLERNGKRVGVRER